MMQLPYSQTELDTAFFGLEDKFSDEEGLAKLKAEMSEYAVVMSEYFTEDRAEVNKRAAAQPRRQRRHPRDECVVRCTHQTIPRIWTLHGNQAATREARHFEPRSLGHSDGNQAVGTLWASCRRW